MEYLDEVHPEPKLLPVDPLDRAYVRAFSHIIACEIHPLNNCERGNTSSKTLQARRRGREYLVRIGSPRVSR